MIDNSNIKKQKSDKFYSRALGLVFISISLIFTVFCAFGVPDFVKSVCLGVFGIMFFPLMLILFLVGIGLVSNMKFVYSAKYVFYLLGVFFCIVCIIQIAVTKGLDTTNYIAYLTDCYNTKLTAGGVFIGAFTYAVTGLLHDVAGYVVFSILLIIFSILIINYLSSFKQFAKLSTPVYVKTVVPEKIDEPKENGEQNKQFGLNIIGEDFVNEDDPNNFNASSLPKIANDEDDVIIPASTIAAKEKLGLVKNDLSQKNNLLKQGETSINEILKKDINNSSVNNARPLFSSEKLNGNEEWKNRAVDSAGQNVKPPKFSYNENGRENRTNNTTQAANKNDLVAKRNKEYLDSLYNASLRNENPILNVDNYKQYQDTDFKPVVLEPQYTQPTSPQPEPPKFVKMQQEQQTITPVFQNNFGIAPEVNVAEDNFDDVVLKNEDAPKISPLNPVNFNFQSTNISTKNNSDVIEPNIEQPSNDESLSNNNDQIAEIANQVANASMENEIKDSLSKTYNLPDNLQKNNYRQMSMMGTEKTKKKEPPNFKVSSNYVKPPIDFLKMYQSASESYEEDHQRNIQVLEQVLLDFQIPAKVEAVHRGAAVTRYELRMPPAIPVKKIHAHASDIALALAAKDEIRIEIPIKGKSAVGVEVPNRSIDIVPLRDIIDSSEFLSAKSPLTFALGKDVDGNIFTCNLAKMPHLLVAGSTGSGKSVCLNSLLISFLYRTSPEDLRIILVDPKRVEFSAYNGLPHLLIPEAITEPSKSLKAFDWLIDEMERRFKIFQENYVKNIIEYNSQPDVLNGKEVKLPYIVLVVDELADLVVTLNKKELEDRIIRLTQKARAAGIHLILATQRPSVDIITGSIKINLPSRIAFAVTNFVDSKTILDQGGAEKLLGKGDMLYSPTDSEPVRIQGAFIDTPEVKEIVSFIKANNKAEYDKSIYDAIFNENSDNNDAAMMGGNNTSEGFDVLMPEALKFLIESGQASISMLQRRFAIGFNRAARIIDQMQIAKFISAAEGSKPRVIYITMEDYNKIYGDGN